LPFTGWTGVPKSGYSDVFKDMMRRLRHPNGNITLAIVIREAAAKKENIGMEAFPLNTAHNVERSFSIVNAVASIVA